MNVMNTATKKMTSMAGIAVHFMLSHTPWVDRTAAADQTRRNACPRPARLLPYPSSLNKYLASSPRTNAAVFVVGGNPRLLTVSAALVVFFVVARVSRCRLFDAAASVCTRIDGSSRHRQRRARRSRRRCSMCHVHEQGEGEKEGREQDRTAGGPFHALRHGDGVRDVVDGEGWLVKGVEGRREGQGMGKEVLRRSTKKPEG